MKENELIERVRRIAPGRPLRHALNDIQQARTGALLFFVEGLGECKGLIQPGLILEAPFTPYRLYELAKMDGAIVVSEDLTTIIAANVQLTPDTSIHTNQTGMRHRVAERMAKQTGKMLIAISKRRNTITLFIKDHMHVLAPAEILTAEVNQRVRTAERYSQAFLNGIEVVDSLERANLLSLYEVVRTLEKGLFTMLVSREAELPIAELGDQGRLAEMQLSEILYEIREELENLILDFAREQLRHAEVDQFLYKFNSLSEREILNLSAIARLLGYEQLTIPQMMEMNVKSMGIRFVRQIPRIPRHVALNIGNYFGSLANLLLSDEEELKQVDGIGERRATSIKHAIDTYLKRM